MSNLAWIRRVGFVAGVGAVIAGGGLWASGAAPPGLHRDRPAPRQPGQSGGRGRKAALHPPERRTDRHRSPRLSRLATPTARHPLTILVVGDSLGEDLEYGVEDVLQGDAHVRVVGDAVGSTGLANQAYYNWPRHLEADLKAVHPNVVMVLLGGNDAVGFDYGTEPVGFGTALWHRLYSRRVAAMMTEALRAKARVLWVGLPVMASSSDLSNTAMKMLNRIYRREATVHPGVHYLSTWRLFQLPGGGFTEYLSNSRGQQGIVRDTDGVHIAPPAGFELVGSAAVAALNHWQGLRLCLNPADFWHRFDPPGCAPAPKPSRLAARQ